MMFLIQHADIWPLTYDTETSRINIVCFIIFNHMIGLELADKTWDFKIYPCSVWFVSLWRHCDVVGHCVKKIKVRCTALALSMPVIDLEHFNRGGGHIPLQWNRWQSPSCNWSQQNIQKKHFKTIYCTIISSKKTKPIFRYNLYLNVSVVGRWRLI